MIKSQALTQAARFDPQCRVRFNARMALAERLDELSKDTPRTTRKYRKIRRILGKVNQSLGRILLHEADRAQARWDKVLQEHPHDP